MSVSDLSKIKTIRAGLDEAAHDTARSNITAAYYCKELARAVCGGEGDRDLFLHSNGHNAAISALRDAISPLGGMIRAGLSGAMFARYCTERCGSRKLLPTLSEMMAFGDAEDAAGEGESSGDPSVVQVAYVTGTAADASFEIFARGRDEWRRRHVERVQNACNSVIYGDTDYAIVPIRNGADGRLRTFYRMLEEYELKIVSAATISVGGMPAVSTTFALCSASFGAFAHTPEYMEFSVTGDGSTAADITGAMGAHGHTVREIGSVPAGDRELFHFVVKLGGDVRAALLYLEIFHPSHTVLGLYDYANT